MGDFAQGGVRPETWYGDYTRGLHPGELMLEAYDRGDYVLELIYSYICGGFWSMSVSVPEGLCQRWWLMLGLRSGLHYQGRGTIWRGFMSGGYCARTRSLWSRGLYVQCFTPGASVWGAWCLEPCPGIFCQRGPGFGLMGYVKALLVNNDLW